MSFVCFFFLGPHLQHMEVPRLRVKSELQPLAIATAMLDPSLVCNLHHSSWQRRIPDPLSQARDQIHILMKTSWIRFRCTTVGTTIPFLILASIMVYSEAGYNSLCYTVGPHCLSILNVIVCFFLFFFF